MVQLLLLTFVIASKPPSFLAQARRSTQSIFDFFASSPLLPDKPVPPLLTRLALPLHTSKAPPTTNELALHQRAGVKPGSQTVAFCSMLKPRERSITVVPAPPSSMSVPQPLAIHELQTQVPMQAHEQSAGTPGTTSTPPRRQVVKVTLQLQSAPSPASPTGPKALPYLSPYSGRPVIAGHSPQAVTSKPSAVIPPPPPLPLPPLKKGPAFSTLRKTPPALPSEPLLSSQQKKEPVPVPLLPPPPPFQPKKRPEVTVEWVLDPVVIPPPLPVLTPQVSTTMPFLHIRTLPKSDRIVVIDIESTGLGKGHKPTEIACIEMRDGRITGKQFHTLINPEREVNTEAYVLTGYTWEFLRHSPPFKDIALDLLEFIKDATLVFHGADNDLKWLNEAFKSSGIDFKLQQRDIIDTFPFAKQLYPSEKNSLDALCQRYKACGVGERTNGKHNALVDAKMLAQVYSAITPKNWFSIAGDIKNTEGEAYFQKMGVQYDLPSSFRFYQELGQIDPTILTSFCDNENNITGLYMRNLGDNPQKRFFGSVSGLADIYPGNPRTLLIGNIMNALLARDIVWGEYAQRVYQTLGIKEGLCIKAYAHVTHLSVMQPHDQLRTIVVLNEKPESLKGPLTDFFRDVIKPSNSKITLKVVPSSLSKASQTETPKERADRICNAIQINTVEDLDRLWPELALLEKIEWARQMYASAEKAPSEAAKRYLIKRGIAPDFPESFRYAELRHNWTQSTLPAMLVPLFKRDAITGVHRIFFNTDGTPLDPQYKKQRKVSLGDAVDVEVKIYEGSILENHTTTSGEAGVVLISEGIENALVARDAILATAKKAPQVAQKMYTHLNISDTFAIKSCVGINGLMGIPISAETHTIIILADNDGNNIDVKRTMRETVAYFLNRGLIVKIAMPTATERLKMDLNDTYLRSDGTKDVRKVTEVLRSAVQVNTIEELGSDTESLQKSLQKIQEKTL